MKMTKLSKVLSLILCFVLVAAIALIGSGCNDNTSSDPAVEKEFTFTVTHSDGEEKNFELKSEKKTVGEALIDEGLISGEDGMVYTVDGETVKYEDSGKYWAFYIDGAYAMTGVDSTDIKDGHSYAFKVE
ncbi:MAG: hypothetical protein J6Q74_00305 [Clostridia bacterium]|nr:hypothetical protein [Clostridia bacterium]